jgi:uncharacterized membrane protein YqjE
VLDLYLTFQKVEVKIKHLCCSLKMNKKQVMGVLLAPVLTYVFILSGLTCSLLSLLLLIIWPFAKNLYRRLVIIIGYSIFSRK